MSRFNLKLGQYTQRGHSPEKKTQLKVFVDVKWPLPSRVCRCFMELFHQLNDQINNREQASKTRNLLL